MRGSRLPRRNRWLVLYVAVQAFNATAVIAAVRGIPLAVSDERFQSSIMYAALVLNAGAYSHTSIALLDALRALDEPLIEVHLSNIYRRETFRQHSYVSLAAKGVICGFGPQGYLMALRALAAMWDDAQ